MQVEVQEGNPPKNSAKKSPFYVKLFCATQGAAVENPSEGRSHGSGPSPNPLPLYTLAQLLHWSKQ